MTTPCDNAGDSACSTSTNNANFVPQRVPLSSVFCISEDRDNDDKNVEIAGGKEADRSAEGGRDAEGSGDQQKPKAKGLLESVQEQARISTKESSSTIKDEDMEEHIRARKPWDFLTTRHRVAKRIGC